LRGLKATKAKLTAEFDSISLVIYNTTAHVSHPAYNSDEVRRNILSDQLPKYEKLISEYQLLADNKPPVLLIAERARVSDWPDKPKRLPVLAATFILSLLFGLLLILLIEKSKTIKK
jgi:hypothetical protein